jgi:hypothetical protein
MTPEPLALDEMPDAEPFVSVAEPTFTDGADDLGKVQCPECDKSFLPAGIKRHITMAHRGGISDGPTATKTSKPKSVVDIANRWAEFQRGAALMVSLACSQCAGVLVADAVTDGNAIAAFCSRKPKLKKQLETFLDSSDIIILVGALAGTAQKMAAHHSIGQRIGLGSTSTEADHTHPEGSMQNIMDFMQNMDPDMRNELINSAFDAKQAAQPQSVPDMAPSGV